MNPHVQQLLIDANELLDRHYQLVALGNSYHKSLYRARNNLIISNNPKHNLIGLEIIDLVVAELQPSINCRI